MAVAPTPRLAAVVGPTASGKSAVAMALAGERDDVELVSIDAMQVYRGMDIGTAKPSPDDRALVRHHLLDIVEPLEEFTVAEFQAAFDAVRDDLAARRRHGVLVGGTGLYHRVVIDDLTMPGEWPTIRARLLHESADVGPEPLHERLTRLDPVAAARMEPTNVRRIVRALEVCEGSGRPFSTFGPGLGHYPPSPIVQIGLRWERRVLADRIEQRVRLMVDDGLVDEVARLHEAGMSRTARQALGYKEILDALDGRCTVDEAVSNVIVRTRQFAVRQLRWFQRDPRVRWVEITEDPVAEALPELRSAFAP